MSRIRQSVYGFMPDGEEVTQYKLLNANGIEVTLISYGGIITAIKTPDKHGNIGNIVLHLESLEHYISSQICFGALIGRYANRISNSQFTIGDTTFLLDKNNGKHHIHGGAVGFNRRNWQATNGSLKNASGESNVGVKMQLVSCDGDQGYPGNLTVTVDYRLTDDNKLTINYTATTDKTTHINLTQHPYFNLATQGTILDHQATIYAHSINEVDHELIPTGKLIPVDDTAFDFRTAKAIGKDINNNDQQLQSTQGYDHSFALFKPNQQPFDLAATVHEPTSGRRLRVYTEEPSLQFYTANLFDSVQQRDSSPYTQWSGFCLEPQHFPDSPNNPHFPSTLLHPGDVFSTSMSYQFDTVEE